jgi:uncharacterized tellurite resistance protein B-like protein
VGLFNFFKKSFTSNFNKNQEDEIVATLRLLYLMHSADDIETLEEEDYIHFKYLNSFGLSQEKQSELQYKALPSKWTKDSISDSEFNAILNKLNDTQKLRIITELVQLIGVDNHVSDKEVDFLFKTSKTLNVEDSIVNSLLEPIKNSLKNAKNALPRDHRWYFSSEYGSLELLLKRQTRRAKETAKAAGLDDDDMRIVDYSYWFEAIKARNSIPADNEDASAEIRMINGHYEEYHFRMLDHIDEDKTQFVFMRIIAFNFIYNQINGWNISHYSKEELSKYNNLLFHAKTSFYGAVKFAIMDINVPVVDGNVFKDGKDLLDKHKIEFDEKLINQQVPINPKEDELKRKSVKLFSKSFLNLLNLFLSQNANKIIKDKKNTRYKAIIDNINTLFPLSKGKLSEKNIDIHDPNYYNRFSKSQIAHFNGLLCTLIITSEAFQFDDYSDFIVDFHKKTNLPVPHIIKDKSDKSDKSDDSDDSVIKDIESYLGGDDNPNKNLFLWAYDFNAGKKGTSIPAEKINKMIEEELLIVEKLPDTARLAAEVDINLGYITYGGFIRIDIEYMAGILNKTEDDKFYRWEDVEQYHAIYTLVFDYINKTYGLE